MEDLDPIEWGAIRRLARLPGAHRKSCRSVNNANPRARRYFREARLSVVIDKSAPRPQGGTIRCPLSGAKRTCLFALHMSAFDPKRTYAKYAPLPQRDHETVEVGGDDQSRLTARQGQHRAVLVGQHDRARAGADRNARAGSAVDAINI